MIAISGMQIRIAKKATVVRTTNYSSENTKFMSIREQYMLLIGVRYVPTQTASAVASTAKVEPFAIISIIIRYLTLPIVLAIGKTYKSKDDEFLFSFVSIRSLKRQGQAML